MFKKQHHVILKNAINLEFAHFLFKYFLMKEQVCYTLKTIKYLPPNCWDYGLFNDNQCNNAFATYGDIAFETLLEQLKPQMEKATGLSLIPTYAYARLYREGSELKAHKDRDSCDISTTLFLGGDRWPIWFKIKGKKKYINLNPGDMIAYRGTMLEHGRDPFHGSGGTNNLICAQVFLHYNKADTRNRNLYDNRPHLGIFDKSITKDVVMDDK